MKHVKRIVAGGLVILTLTVSSVNVLAAPARHNRGGSGTGTARSAGISRNVQTERKNTEGKHLQADCTGTGICDGTGNGKHVTEPSHEAGKGHGKGNGTGKGMGLRDGSCLN